MSHEITDTDTLTLAGKGAWHGIGNVLDAQFSTKEALGAGGMDWEVKRTQLVTQDTHQLVERFANIRQDTGEVLGTVGPNYRILQNAELAQYVQGTLGEDAKLDSAGSLRGGADVFFLAALPPFDVTRGDRVNPYALFSNAHDGSRSFRVMPTSVRVVCANTLNAALGAAGGINIRHTASMLDTIDSAQEALGAAIQSGSVLQLQAKELAQREMSAAELQSFFVAVYQRAYGVIPINPQDAQEERKVRRAASLVGDWSVLFEQPQNRIGGTHLWGALNSVTEWADHSRKASDRMHSNLLGSSAAFKAGALDYALSQV